MKFAKVLFSIALGILISAPGIGTSEAEKESPAKVAERKGSETAKLSDDFQKARESFLKKEFKASAAAIRRGAAYFMKLQERAVENRSKAFTASQKAMAKLAHRVENGLVKSVGELDRTFARAYHALSEYHYRKAVEFWAKKEAAQAGRELEAASAYLEKGVKQAGERVEGGMEAVLKDTRLLAGKMIQGAGWGKEEVEKGIKSLEAEIKRLGAKVETPKKT